MATIDFTADKGRDWHIDVGEDGAYFVIAGDQVIMRAGTTEEEVLDAACAIIARFADNCATGQACFEGLDPDKLSERGEIARAIAERISEKFAPIQ